MGMGRNEEVGEGRREEGGRKEGKEKEGKRGRRKRKEGVRKGRRKGGGQIESQRVKLKNLAHPTKSA